jgi:hypothetical protein
MATRNRHVIGLLLSVVWYGAAAAFVLSLIGLVRPARRLGMSTRRRATVNMAIALAVFVLLAIVPPPVTRVAARMSELDEVAPTYHYAERHSQYINASPAQVYSATKTVTAEEIWLFRTFTSLRRFGQPGPESILNAPEHLPLLDVALRSGFVLLSDRPPREVVFGAIVAAPPRSRRKGPVTPDFYRTISAPGFVKATMNFRIEPDGTGSRITTETRVHGTDTAAILRFTPYWRTILPGSWILRMTWLDAIRRRAEGQK